ncbi:MAG: YvcK family protein [Acidobacteria bacterium]|nr:YvcK family protein [Acidobacteriota bacterium]
MTVGDMIPYPIRVVALGGGTGLPEVLRGFKAILFPNGADDAGRLVAVVTVTDDGGSSGRLREELGMLPPGDIRNCLVALSHNEPLMARLFQARFSRPEDLDGHPVGNLILAALAQEEHEGFLAAIKLAGEVLNIQGRVCPSTLVPTRLMARLFDGREVAGETALVEAASRVERLWLEPPRPPAAPGVAEAIRRADIVAMGPGSLYTSILPNLLIPEVAAALRETCAFRVLVVNAMTERGETEGFGAAEHVRAVLAYAGAGSLDAVLVPEDVVPDETLARYQEEGAMPVAVVEEELRRLVPLVVRRPLLHVAPVVRHDPLRTAGGILAAFALHRDRVAAARRQP